MTKERERQRDRQTETERDRDRERRRDGETERRRERERELASPFPCCPIIPECEVKENPDRKKMTSMSNLVKAFNT